MLLAMNRELDARVKALEQRVEQLEALLQLGSLLGGASPPNPVVEEKVRVPTREMIACWLTNRERKGFGPELKLARHGAAFADLFNRCHCDLAVACNAIDRFFVDKRPSEFGWPIGSFTKFMDTYVAEAVKYEQKAAALREAHRAKEHPLTSVPQAASDPAFFEPFDVDGAVRTLRDKQREARKVTR